MDFLKKLFGMGGDDNAATEAPMNDESMEEQVAVAVETDMTGEAPQMDNTDAGAMSDDTASA